MPSRARPGGRPRRLAAAPGRREAVDGAGDAVLGESAKPSSSPWLGMRPGAWVLVIGSAHAWHQSERAGQICSDVLEPAQRLGVIHHAPVRLRQDRRPVGQAVGVRERAQPGRQVRDRIESCLGQLPRRRERHERPGGCGGLSSCGLRPGRGRCRCWARWRCGCRCLRVLHPVAPSWPGRRIRWLHRKPAFRWIAGR